MGIINNSFLIDCKITEITFNYVEEEGLVQGRVYDPSKHAIVDNISRKPIFELQNNPNVITFYDRFIYIRIPENDLAVGYELQPETNGITKISHLIIKKEDGSYVALFKKSLESYIDTLNKIPKEYIKGLFINLMGEIKLFSEIDWKEWVEKQLNEEG